MRARGTAVALLALAASIGAGTVGKLVPVPFEQVTIEDSFWSPRLETNRTVSIPHNLDTCESTGRIDNFRHAAGVTPKGKFRGHIFHDSDVFKVLEGVAYSLHTHPDPKLEARLDEIIGYIAKSQQPDGYLNTWFIVAKPKERWKNLRGAHELYCAGHMFEAAVAHFRATGKRTFLDVACKYADYIDSVFGPGKRHGIAGHPEIELALVKLWRATGNDRYLKLARFFVEEHGNSKDRKLFGGYCQDHAPVREQTEPVGHAVRFLYFYSGVADLAGTDGDQGYIDTMERLWQFIVTKKMYVTGGVGVQGHGEGFAKPYYLPNYQAYCETCASIGMVFWNHRLALLHGEGRFADLVERLLYNGAISGVALDGSKFFYVNPLASRGNHHRQPWYGCACCPTNVVRFISSVGQYVYGRMADGEGVAVLCPEHAVSVGGDGDDRGRARRGQGVHRGGPYPRLVRGRGGDAQRQEARCEGEGRLREHPPGVGGGRHDRAALADAGAPGQGGSERRGLPGPPRRDARPRRLLPGGHRQPLPRRSGVHPGGRDVRERVQGRPARRRHGAEDQGPPERHRRDRGRLRGRGSPG